MANGETQPISDIEVGDKVLATDPETGETTAREVTATHVMHHEADLLDVTITGPDGTTGVVETTDGHKFWSATATEWTEAQHLDAGEHLRQPDGTTATVITLTPQDGQAHMWDLTVAVDHNYYVTYSDSADDAVLVHNCGVDDIARRATPDFADGARSPGAGWEWRGSGSPGSSQGNWYNPTTRESLHPDLRHGGSIGGHYDYKAPDGTWYRWFSDGRIEPK